MITRLFIIALLMFSFIGSDMAEKESVSDTEFYNLSNQMSYNNINLTFNEKANDNNLSFVPRSIYKYADFFAFTATEGLRKSMEFGYENKDYNFNLAWRLMFLTLFAALVIPLIQILLFVGYGIYNIKELIIKKKNEHNKKD